jgi:lysophospholipase L1-like esterase
MEHRSVTGAIAANLIPASDPGVWYTGRTQINADGTRTFDWEGTQMYVNVKGATYVSIVVNASGGILGRFSVHTNGWETSSFFVGGGNGAITTNTFMGSYDLDPGQSWTIRAISYLEPSFSGANENAALTFIGFVTDGTVAPAGPARSRRIELLGDSISAGYGARGFVGAPGGCPVNDFTSGNIFTYGWMLAENFTADFVPIAWSGKGMYQNCCDNGETMPSYYLQTLAGKAYSTDWDFTRYVPDAIIINLGTNDFGHDSGPAWEAAFTSTYVQWVQNATTRYGNPKLPIFVSQGPMNNGAPLYNALQSAIKTINAAGGAATYLDMRGPPNDGCGGHPGVAGHMGMFEMAQPVIKAVMGW